MSRPRVVAGADPRRGEGDGTAAEDADARRLGVRRVTRGAGVGARDDQHAAEGARADALPARVARRRSQDRGAHVRRRPVAGTDREDPRRSWSARRSRRRSSCSAAASASARSSLGAWSRRARGRQPLVQPQDSRRTQPAAHGPRASSRRHQLLRSRQATGLTPEVVPAAWRRPERRRRRRGEARGPAHRHVETSTRGLGQARRAAISPGAWSRPTKPGAVVLMHDGGGDADRRSRRCRIDHREAQAQGLHVRHARRAGCSEVAPAQPAARLGVARRRHGAHAARRDHPVDGDVVLLGRYLVEDLLVEGERRSAARPAASAASRRS